MAANGKSRRLILVGLAVCFLAGLATTADLLYLHSSTRGLPYHDSFTEGKADEWKAFGGTWAVYDGGMRNDSDERGAKLMTGSGYWTDYVLEADIRLLGEDGDAGLVIRASDAEEGVDSYRGYYAGLRTRDNRLTLGLADHGWQEYEDAPIPHGVQAFQWYHLKLLAWDCDVVASATFPLQNGETTTAAVHDRGCQKAGGIGLRSYSSGGIWRNVRVRRATAADLQAMLAGHTLREITSNQPYWNGTSIFGSGSLPSHVNPEPALAEAAVQPIASLRMVISSRPVTATVRGVVTLASPALYVQDSTGGVAVLAESSPPLKVGDEVLVTGQVNPHDYSATLDHAGVRLLWTRNPMAPISLTPEQAATGSFTAMFIELEGTFTGATQTPHGAPVLSLAAGQQAFRAVVENSRGSVLAGRLKRGSLLRMRGVCVVNPADTHNLTPFVLLLPSADDVEVVAGPPWWNTRHVVIIGFFVLLLAFIGHLIYSTVETWRLKAVAEERELLAHEMHDTLAQSFAGLGFQLQAIRNRLPVNMPKVQEQLDLACDLVRHSHEEARRQIMMLRAESPEKAGLAPLLESCARHMLEGGDVQVEAVQEGDCGAIPLRIKDTLFRIGQEALANAVRHARPSRIRILAHCDDDSVALTIEDDGRGYQHGSEGKGFGVHGMRRRAGSIGANMTIATSPGQGTRVVVLAPLPRRGTLSIWAGLLWKRLR
ncbi:MAG TPA: histidine kinase, partial [Acidobacteriaceae bacterium]|nr:histidine kinase [Acidobacteriaceae bacterium]